MHGAAMGLAVARPWAGRLTSSWPGVACSRTSGVNAGAPSSMSPRLSASLDAAACTTSIAARRHRSCTESPPAASAPESGPEATCADALEYAPALRPHGVVAVADGAGPGRQHKALQERSRCIVQRRHRQAQHSPPRGKRIGPAGPHAATRRTCRQTHRTRKGTTDGLHLSNTPNKVPPQSPMNSELATVPKALRCKHA